MMEQLNDRIIKEQEKKNPNRIKANHKESNHTLRAGGGAGGPKSILSQSMIYEDEDTSPRVNA
jgi:hypothetical protein